MRDHEPSFTSDTTVVSILRAANDLLSRVEFAGMVSSEIDDVNTEVSMLAGRTKLVQTRLASRMRELADDGHASDPNDVLGRRNGMSGGEASKITRHAELLKQFPAFETALNDGKIADGHLDALAAHVRLLDDADRLLCVANGVKWANLAVRTSVEDFRSHLAKIRRELDARNGVPEKVRQVRRNTMRGGAVAETNRWEFNLNLDPVAGERMNTALESEMRSILQAGEADSDITSDHNRLRALALSNLVSVGFQANKNAPTGSAVTEVAILMDEKTWREGVHAHTVCETRTGLQVDLDDAIRAVCDSKIYRIVLDADGKFVDLSNTFRLASADQRKTLRGLHRTCSAHRCKVPFDRCEIHHVQAFNGFNTVLANLTPLCSRHHHMVHDQGWRVHIDENRTVTFQRPDGTWDEPQPLQPLLTTPADEATCATGRPPDTAAPPDTGPPDSGPPAQPGLFDAA